MHENSIKIITDFVEELRRREPKAYVEYQYDPKFDPTFLIRVRNVHIEYSDLRYDLFERMFLESEDEVLFVEDDSLCHFESHLKTETIPATRERSFSVNLGTTKKQEWRFSKGGLKSGLKKGIKDLGIVLAV